MSIHSYNELGTKSHIEAFGVLLGFGLIMGLMLACFDFFGINTELITGVTKQAIAIALFFVLSFAGLFAILFTEPLPEESWLSKTVRLLAIPTVRVGISAGAGTSGILLGIGLSGMLVYALTLSCQAFQSALTVFAYGVLVLSMTWPIFYLFAEILNVQTKRMSVATSIYAACAIALMIYVQMKLFFLILIVGGLLGCVISFFIIRKVKATQRGAAVDRPKRWRTSGGN